MIAAIRRDYKERRVCLKKPSAVTGGLPFRLPLSEFRPLLTGPCTIKFCQYSALYYEEEVRHLHDNDNIAVIIFTLKEEGVQPSG